MQGRGQNGLFTDELRGAGWAGSEQGIWGEQGVSLDADSVVSDVAGV